MQHTDSYKFFYLHDRLGSVRQVINAAGSVIRLYSYDPFGQLVEQMAAPPLGLTNSFLFAGQWYDSEIGQYYLRARQYDPRIGRFTARDPVFGNFQEPLTLHAYLYCLNDPVNRIDPSGEMAAARVLVAPVLAGHLAHALAITIAVHAVTVANSNTSMDLAIAMEQGISDVIALVTVGVHPKTALEWATRSNLPKEYKWGDPRNIEYQIWEMEQGMQGNPQFRNNDPNKWWQRIILHILEFIDSLKG
jgi:RHS repeat-associated protein